MALLGTPTPTTRNTPTMPLLFLPLLLLTKAWLHVVIQSLTPATPLTSGNLNQGTTPLPPSLHPALPPCTAATTTPRNTTPNNSSSSNSNSSIMPSNINPHHTTPFLNNNKAEEKEEEEEEGQDTAVALHPALPCEAATKECQEVHLKAACLLRVLDQQQLFTPPPSLRTKPPPSLTNNKCPSLPPSFPPAFLSSPPSERAKP